jgi:hypothetical protein
MTVNIWGRNAKRHWQENRPASYAALDDPESFFSQLGEEAAARYLMIRDQMVEGLNPNDGTISWSEFQDRTAQADQAAQEIVEREMIYLEPTAEDLTQK